MKRIRQLFTMMILSRTSKLLLTHAAMVGAAYSLSFVLRFEFPVPAEDRHTLFVTLPLAMAIRLITFAVFHLYEEVWHYVSMRDVLRILKATTLSSVVFGVIVLGLVNRDFPWPIFLIDWGVCLLFVGGARLVLRAAWEWRHANGAGKVRRALIIGAGNAGELLIREVGRNPTLDYEVVGFVDDDNKKCGRRIHGVEVVGIIDELPALCRKFHIQALLIAIPSATGAEMRRIIEVCRSSKLEFKTMPSLGELRDAQFTVSRVRRVNIDDLLRRDPVEIDQEEVARFIRDKRVLVTGAGGSIGSELTRQICRFQPQLVVLLDQAENNLFFVGLELRDRFPDLPLELVIADVADAERIQKVFECSRPHLVFHAAAHKHVPLMECNKGEAVKNNVRGTKIMAETAIHNGAEAFVMISTDKAVRPTSVMGATKRLAEMYVQALNVFASTRFMTVRFGNVLGSEGSVLQIFQRQIEAGGPVTITHPDMRRYFMTIPEASQLVLQAATQGEGGEIFVLDMGEPVKIVDLARDIITLSGLEPEKDIEIKFIGPRPGEKMFEELLNSETRVLPTPHQKIMVVEAEPESIDLLREKIEELLKYADSGDEQLVVARLNALVPDYVNGAGACQALHRRSKRILLVEHDSYTRTTMKRILESNYRIAEAETAEQAVEGAIKFHPDLAIVDLHIPDADIRDLCSQLRYAARDSLPTLSPAHPGLPILLLAEANEASGKGGACESSGEARIFKPIQVSLLQSQVQSLLKNGDPSEEG